MSYRDALKVFKLERALNDDETAFLNTLRAMSESDLGLLSETLAPEKPVKKPAAERNIEHCGVCDYTRRAIHHKDTTHKDYHEFQSPSQQPKKSRRAASISDAIQGTAGAAGKVIENNHCIATVDDNGGQATCGKPEDDPIHDSTYSSSHFFSPAASGAARKSPPNGKGAKSTASSATDSEGAGTAHHAAS